MSSCEICEKWQNMLDIASLRRCQTFLIFHKKFLDMRLIQPLALCFQHDQQVHFSIDSNFSPSC